MFVCSVGFTHLRIRCRLRDLFLFSKVRIFEFKQWFSNFRSCFYTSLLKISAVQENNKNRKLREACTALNQNVVLVCTVWKLNKLLPWNHKCMELVLILLRLKLRYYDEATKFKKSLRLFFKLLWPFQKTWTFISPHCDLHLPHSVP